MIRIRLLTASLLATALSVPVFAKDEGAPNLSGVWARTTFGVELPLSGPGPLRNLTRRADGTADPMRIIGDYNSPILKPETAAAVRHAGESALKGEDYPGPSNTCWPMVPPYVYRVIGMQLLQSKDEVTILYMQDHQVRHVRINGTHPANFTPTYSGDSIGHYEGDTLVIDTVGFKVGPVAALDFYGTPYSSALHVVERYRLVDYAAARVAIERNEKEYGHPTTEQAIGVDTSPANMGLQVSFTVEDNAMFTVPWSGGATYLRAKGDWVENVCAENTNEYYAGRQTAVPQAGKPDF